MLGFEKAKRFFVALSVAAFLLSCAIFASALSGKNADVTAVAPAGSGSDIEMTPRGYIVRSYMGKVAVFENGSPLPDEIFEVWVSQLPPPDKTLLDQGIPAVSEEELQAVLEDYIS